MKDCNQAAVTDVVSGPHRPSRTVSTCDVGGEPLPTSFGWWLVAATDRGWHADRGASCAEHAGQPPAPLPTAGRAPSGYAAAVELEQAGAV